MASGKTLQSTIEIAGVLSPSLQAAFDKAVDRLKDISEETLESADAASRLVAEMDEQEDILKTLQKAYAGYVANGEESSDQAQELADKIRDVSDELEENRDTLKAAEKAAQRLTDTQEDAADAFSILEKKIKSQEDDLAALRRQYANVVLEQGESSDEARQLANEIKELSNEVQKNKKKFSEAETVVDKWGRVIEDAGDDARNSSDGYTVLKDVIAGLAEDAVRDAAEAFKELAFEGDKALAMLEARTGVTGDNLEGYGDIIREVYNGNYGDSLGDVSETLSTVIQMTDDLDNASLTKVTKNSLALNDVFGFDTVESLRAVNSLVDQFGITSDQAYNLIVQGAQNGLNQNDDLLDTINEYAVQFKDAGYSADDMFNMLMNGAETGTWSVDKLGDAVKEFNIRMSDGTANEYLEQLGVDADKLVAQFNKGGPEAQKAIDTVMEAILNCDDATLQYQAGVGLFGTMWEDLGAETVASLMETKGAIDSNSDAMSQMDTAAYDTLQDKLAGLGRKYKGVGSAILGTAGAAGYALTHWDDLVAKFGTAKATFAKIGPAISGAIGGISATAIATALAVVAVVAVIVGAFVSLWKNNEEFRAKMTAIWDGIKSKFEEFGQGIVDRLNALGFDFENFTEVMKAAWDAFCSVLAPIFEGLFQQLSNILSGALDILLGIFDIFAGIFTGDWDMVWEGVKGVFGAVWDFLVATFQNYLNVFTNLADVVLGWFGTSWEEVWTSTKDFFVNIWDSIVSFFSGIWESIKTTCSTAWEFIKNAVQFGLLFIKNLFSAAFQLITLPFRFIWENCKDTVLKVWTAIKDTISEKLNAAKEKVTAVTDKIKTVAGNAWSAVSSAASSKWESIKNTIGSKISAAKDKVSSVTGKIKTVAGDAWSAVSSAASSKWESIKNTIGNKITAAKDKVSSVTNGIKSTMSSVLGGALSKVQSIFGSIYDSIKGKMDAAKNAVGNAIQALKDKFNFSWSLPKLKLPHISISGSWSFNPPSVPKFGISWYKDGGILTQPTIFGATGSTLLAGGEAGHEAVLPLAVLWDKMEAILRNILNGQSSTGEAPSDGLTATAGKLLTLDDFSLGSLANNTNVVIYYDFSGFTWSPQIQMNGNSDDEDDFMAKLRAHEAEFFDWLEEFIQMREVAQYA